MNQKALGISFLAQLRHTASSFPKLLSLHVINSHHPERWMYVQTGNKTKKNFTRISPAEFLNPLLVNVQNAPQDKSQNTE